MSSLTTYSFKNVQATIDGKPVRGFWEGDDAVIVAQNSDTATAVVGVGGDATVSVSADDAVQITLKLQPNSPTNAVLNAKHMQMRNGRAVPFPVSIRDTGNGEGGSAPNAVIMKAPSQQFGNAASVREWVIFANPWNRNEISYV